MPQVTIEVSRLEETQMHRLLDIEKRAFSGRRVIRYYHGAIARIEVGGNDAAQLLDALTIGLDDPASESFAEQHARSAGQGSLTFPDYAPGDPLTAKLG
jgi:hypothetical protein